MHISRISRENEKWFCETFLARNAAARNCEKNRPFLANFGSNLTKFWPKFEVFSNKVTSFLLNIALPDEFHWFYWSFNKIHDLPYFEKEITKKIVLEVEVLQWKWFLAFLAFSREKWVNFSRISREMKNARNVHV